MQLIIRLLASYKNKQQYKHFTSLCKTLGIEITSLAKIKTGTFFYLDLRNVKSSFTPSILAQFLKAIPDTLRSQITHCDFHSPHLHLEDVQAIACALPNLHSFDASTFSDITSHGLTRIAKSCRALEEISLQACKNISDQSLRTLAKHCPKLRKVDVHGCKNIGDRGIVSLARHCPDLIHLNVRGCSNVTDKTIKALATYSHQLTTVYFEKNAISGEGLLRWNASAKSESARALYKISRLSRVTLINQPNITSTGLVAFAKAHPQLEMIDITGSSAAISDRALIEIYRVFSRWIVKGVERPIEKVPSLVAHMAIERCNNISETRKREFIKNLTSSISEYVLPLFSSSTEFLNRFLSNRFLMEQLVLNTNSYSQSEGSLSGYITRIDSLLKANFMQAVPFARPHEKDILIDLPLTKSSTPASRISNFSSASGMQSY